MYEYKAKMINVVDGDTMDFELQLGFHITHNIRVRLLGVDTPEIYHPKSIAEKSHGFAAKAFVENVFLNEVGVIKTYKDKKGKYGRYLADFIIKEDDNTTTSLVLSLKVSGFEKKESYE